MMNRKRVFWATTALFTGLLAAGAASAQSTATEATEVETVVVTGQRGQRTIDGAIAAETVAKNRSTITQEFISTQPAGQTILQSLNLTPGLNFTNNDPYGSSGGNIRLHGLDGNRVSLTFDGIPLNDTGNYATFTNQQLDPELIERATVNTGTTDVDSPTASAIGGTINYTTLRTTPDMGGFIQGSLGDFDYKRIIGVIQTGEIGPWGTSAWFAASYQNYDKFKGIGELEKQQYNFKIYQPLGDNGDFVALSGHYNQNRNNAFTGPNLRTATGSLPDQIVDPTNPFGYNVDFNRTYSPITTTAAPAGQTGDVDVDPAANSNYWGIRINPSNTGNIRGQSKIHLMDNLIFTFDPSFQYVLANGGGQNGTFSERDALLRGTTGASAPTIGIDLNGDGDTLDTVRVMTPSNTNTHRYGVNTSLIFDLNDDHQFRGAYTLDWGRHRQTGEWAGINFSNPNAPEFLDIFGGRNEENLRIVNRDGYFLRARDRKSIAELNQFAFEYRGFFLDQSLRLNLGVRAPFFTRELNQYCFSQNASSNVRCTSETPNATLASGNVTFASTGTTQYIRPYSTEKKYDKVLPNIGAFYRFGEGHSVYGSYSQNLSAPRTDSLYTVLRLPNNTVTNPNVAPETSETYDAGYRYSAGTLVASVSGFYTNYENRIVNTFDEDLGYFVDRNVGDVIIKGIDASLGWSPIEPLTLYASASFNDSELQSDFRVNATTIAATKGKELVETPDMTYGLRVSYEFNDVFSAGIQAKYVGERWITDVNDLKDDSYTTADIDARFDFATFGFEGTYLQFNVTNVTDEQYYGSLGTTTSATPGAPGFARPFAQVGSPRTAMASLRIAF
ncbi:MAG: TonB-dependent receptor [Brevundimonas sp.]|nr:TonB-dependent receptor [Brevundimonas sp.]